MLDLDRLLRPHLKGMVPYSSARDEFQGQASVFLDANENPFGSLAGNNFHRYPDPHQSVLKEKLAKLKGVSIQQVFLGNGSDEVIDLLFRAFCEPASDQVIINPPTYGMYSVSARVNNVEIIEVPLTRNFEFDLENTLQSVNDRTKLIFICSPNNPSGNLLDKQKILNLVQAFSGLVVVDEAYIDFADDDGFLPLLDNYDNLFVMQTFSKAWGMAGLRLGIGYGNPQLIALLDKIKPPYNINSYTQQAAWKSLGNSGQQRQWVAEILQQRNWLKYQLEQLELVDKVYPSDANFLLAVFSDPKGVYSYLVDNHIIVRDRSKVQLCEGSLRITVGTNEENRQLIQYLEKYGQ